MGRSAQILLVILLGLLAVSSASRAVADCPSQPVRAAGYRDFWLWGGVRLPADIRELNTLYLYQGEVTRRRGWVRGGQPLAKLHVPRLWLTVRLETLELSDAQLLNLARLAQRWQRAGNRVVGLQLDFDAASYRLAEYGTLLTRLRQRLPAEFALGVTGLLDWAQTGSVAALNRLPVDELVIQTYQGRQTVSDYARYLNALQALKRPFRIGLVQGGEWQPCQQAALARSPWYRGAVVFVVSGR